MTIVLKLGRPKTFVIEGPDGAGKSTLIDAIKSADQNIETVHPGKPPTDYDALLKMLNHQMTYVPGSTLVYDRITAISEYVYRPFRLSLTSDPENECAVRFSLIESMMLLALNLDWTIIYCRPSRVAIYRNCNQFTEHDTVDTKKVVNDHISDVVDRYDTVMRQLELDGCKVIRFDYEKMSLGDLAKAICGEGDNVSRNDE